MAITYPLTLTREERKAIDWVGYRYNHGDELYSILISGLHLPENAEWDDNCDITFYVREDNVWQIRDNAASEDGDHEFNWPCFCPELTQKMNDFVENTIFRV